MCLPRMKFTYNVFCSAETSILHKIQTSFEVTHFLQTVALRWPQPVTPVHFFQNDTIFKRLVFGKHTRIQHIQVACYLSLVECS